MIRISKIKHFNSFRIKYEIFIENFFQNEVQQEHRLTGFVALATRDRKGCQLALKMYARQLGQN
jgi:hypothetical protein